MRMPAWRSCRARDEPVNSRRRALTVTMALVVVCCAAACAGRVHPETGPRPLRFPADVFAFPNETVWAYDVDPVSKRVAWRTRDPAPAFSLRCGPMARGVRQFFANARFDPDALRADTAEYGRLVHAVLASDPRRPLERPIVIPGYADLRTFSADHAALMQAELAGPWSSHLQRGNWRMIFPFGGRHQEATARALLDDLGRHWPAIVHVLRFPRLTINHMVVVYAAEESPALVRFLAYDPNDASRPVALTYDRAARRFAFSATAYFPGGPVSAYTIYDGLLY
jgi:hypothetical protein